MDLGLEQRGDVAIATLPRIPLDSAFEGEFTKEINGVIERHPHVVLDLKRLLSIDSAGVGALVNALAKARRAGGDIKLVNVPDQVRSVLSVVKLDRLFSTFPTVDDAVAAHAGKP